MHGRPYIGISGIMPTGEVHALSSQYPQDADVPLLALGTLMSEKTLYGETPDQPSRYAKREDVPKGFSYHPHALNIVHYNSRNPTRLFIDMAAIVGMYWEGDHRASGEEYRSLNGIQLNMTWPAVKTFQDFNKIFGDRNLTIILQIGKEALQQVGNDPAKLAERLKAYEHVVHCALLDPSCGTGELLNTTITSRYIQAIRDAKVHMDLSMAGGLDAEHLGFIEPVLRRFPFVSIDAESRLRNRDDQLCLDRCNRYTEKGVALYRSLRP